MTNEIDKWTFNITFIFIEDSCCLTTLCMPVRFLNLSNQPLLALDSLTAALVPGIYFVRSACNSLAFSQTIASKTLSPANCCLLIHTNNNNSTSLIVLLAHLSLLQHQFPWFLFSSPGWNWSLMRTSRTSWRDWPRICLFRTLLWVLSWILSCFLALFIKGLALKKFFGPMVAYLAVALNKQAQKTMDYYKMFWRNTWCDAHSTRNKADWVMNTWDVLCGHSISGNEWPSYTGRRMGLVQTIFNCTKTGAKFQWKKLLKTELYEN